MPPLQRLIADDPPPLPAEVSGRTITRSDQTKTTVVTKRDAARLMGVAEIVITRYIAEGKLDVCRDPNTNEHLVLIDSLWLLVPSE